MKLTKSIQALFVHNLMADIPAKPTQKHMQEVLVEAMSEKCRRIYKENPNALYARYVPFYLVVGDADSKVLMPYMSILNAREDLENRMYAMLRVVSTTARLKAVYPQLAKYLPDLKQERRTNADSAGPSLIEAMRGLGWKGEEK